MLFNCRWKLKLKILCCLFYAVLWCCTCCAVHIVLHILCCTFNQNSVNPLRQPYHCSLNLYNGKCLRPTQKRFNSEKKKCKCNKKIVNFSKSSWQLMRSKIIYILLTSSLQGVSLNRYWINKKVVSEIKSRTPLASAASTDLGQDPKGSHKKACFFWTLSKRGLDPPSPLILDICEITFALAHFGQPQGNFCKGSKFKYLPNI